jgi:hypothetical protein
VTHSAPRPAAARHAQAATAHGRNAAAGEGDDVGHSGHCRSRLRENRQGQAQRGWPPADHDARARPGPGRPTLPWRRCGVDRPVRVQGDPDDCGDRGRVIEVAAFAALAVLALSPAAQPQPAGPAASRSAMLARLQAGVPGARAAAAAASVAALVLLGIAVAGAGGQGASAAGGLRTAKIGGVAVLTNPAATWAQASPLLFRAVAAYQVR